MKELDNYYEGIFKSLKHNIFLMLCQIEGNSKYTNIDLTEFLKDVSERLDEIRGIKSRGYKTNKKLQDELNRRNFQYGELSNKYAKLIKDTSCTEREIINKIKRGLLTKGKNPSRKKIKEVLDNLNKNVIKKRKIETIK